MTRKPAAGSAGADKQGGLVVIDKQVFDWFHERQEVIEESFGHAMKWQRLDDKKSSRISFRKGFEGFDQDEWPQMIEWLVEHMRQLELTSKPLIAEAGTRVKG